MTQQVSTWQLYLAKLYASHHQGQWSDEIQCGPDLVREEFCRRRFSVLENLDIWPDLGGKWQSRRFSVLESLNTWPDLRGEWQFSQLSKSSMADENVDIPLRNIAELAAQSWGAAKLQNAKQMLMYERQQVCAAKVFWSPPSGTSM